MLSDIRRPKKYQKQECIPVGYILITAMATTRCHCGGLSNSPPALPRQTSGSGQPPGCRPPFPWIRTPLDAEFPPPPLDAEPYLLVKRMTDASENITFPCMGNKCTYQNERNLITIVILVNYFIVMIDGCISAPTLFDEERSCERICGLVWILHRRPECLIRDT